jgi:DNA polymerase (family 10)
MENNQAIARQFRQIAALLQEQDVAFKPAAYRRAAQVLEEMPKDIGTYPRDAKELQKLPGIGEAIAGKIIEYLETGKIGSFEKMKLQQVGVSADLLGVEGLGPKRVRQIQNALGLRTVPELIAAAEAGKLRDLPRFDELLEKRILENARRVTERATRFPRADIEDDVERLLQAVKSVPGVERVSAAGSYRRRAETVGDVDILAVTAEPGEVSNAVATLPLVRDVVAHGAKKLSFNLRDGLRVDIRFVRRDQWGSALLYFTGDKEHNIALRKAAIRKGWKLNEYGLFKGNNVIASKTEEDIYRALEVPYHEPPERTGRLSSRTK